MPVAVAQANPNHNDPTACLEGHANKEQVAALFQGYTQIEKEVASFSAAFERGQGERISADRVASVIRSTYPRTRQREELRILAEPAAVEMNFRRMPIGQRLWQIRDAIRAFPLAQQHSQRSKQQLARSEAARMRTLQQILELARQQQWPQAETRLMAELDQLEELTCYFSQSEQEAVFRPYAEARSQVASAMNRLRRQAAAEEFLQRSRALLPDLAGDPAALAEAAKALRAQPAVEIDGSALSGPELFTHFADRWRVAQVASLKSRALAWAAVAASGRAEAHLHGELGAAPAVESDDGQGFVDRHYDAYCRKMTEGLAALTLADAERVGESEARALHARYLAAMAPWAARSRDGALLRALSPALAKLTQKSTELADDAEAYAQASDTLLRWRRRAAEAAAKAKLAQHKPLADQLFAAARSEAAARYTGLYPEHQPDIRVAAILASAPEMLSRPIERLMGASASVADVAALPGGQRGVARYQQRVYATVTLGGPLAEHVERLRSDLAVDDAHPPLSLTAAAALWKAENGDYAQVGGEVVGLHLEGVVTRFATLADAAWLMAPLGPLPDDLVVASGAPEPASHALMRFDLRPAWVRHEHFFAELAPAAESASRPRAER